MDTVHMMWEALDEASSASMFYDNLKRHKWIQQLKKNNRRNKHMRRHMKGGRK